MVGIKVKGGKTQLTVTVYPEHAELIERILQKKYVRPIAHNSTSEIVRRAIEHYAEFLGITISDS